MSFQKCKSQVKLSYELSEWDAFVSHCPLLHFVLNVCSMFHNLSK